MAPYDEELLEVAPVVHTLGALTHGGMDKLDPIIMRALKRDDFSEALAAANRLYSQRGPSDRNAALTYIVLLNGKELTREALDILRKSLEYHSHDIPLQLAQVESLYLQGRFEAAAALLDGLEQAAPQDPRHWGFMGDLYLEMQHEERAIACYRAALQRASDDFELAYRLANLLIERDELDEAAQALERAARLSKGDANIWEMAGDAWISVAEFERALRAYNNVLKLEPTNARAWMSKGVTLSELGQWDRAQQALEKATHIAPEVVDFWLGLGHCQLECASPEQAFESYRKAVELDGDSSEGLNGMVTASFEIGDLLQAEQLAKRAVARAPDSPESHYNLGMILLSLHRPAEAHDPLARAVELDPQVPRFLSVLAQSLVQLDQNDEAERRISQALAISDEDDATPLLEFVEALVRKGDLRKADATMQRANPRDPLWAAMRPLISYLAHAADGAAEDDLLIHATQLREILDRDPSMVPVFWDFEVFERAALLLAKDRRDLYLTMLAALEGRESIEALPLRQS